MFDKKSYDYDEVRKIQFSGKSSYTIALPKGWVQENNLRPGDRVRISRKSDASLVIVPEWSSFNEDKSEVTIAISRKDTMGSIVRKIISMYLLGYKTIHVREREGTMTSIQRNIVKETVHKHLVGAEVIADSTEGITIQVLLGFPELSIENALRRMALIATSMHKDAILALKRFDVDTAKGVIETDDEVDRFGLYIIRHLKMAVQNDRILKEIGLKTPRDCLGYRLIVKSIERIADHACKIAEAVLMIKQPLNELVLDKIERLSGYALKVFEESLLALFKHDYEIADRVVEAAQSIVDMEREFLTMMEKSGFVELLQMVRLIVEGIKRTAEYASDIAEIVLNMTAEQVTLK
ncbi:MAG: phosphate uptake regulator PhoU [Nitrososphaerota archaeon]|nr:phosphate uptake regulator PhoU [Nitrososphaerota archaeon]